MSPKVIPVEPENKLSRYQVECRNKLTGYWEIHSVMRPLFKRDQRPAKQYTLRGVRKVVEEFITNQEAAEDAARARALDVAKTVRNPIDRPRVNSVDIGAAVNIRRSVYVPVKQDLPPKELKDVRVRAFYFERAAGKTYEIEQIAWENNEFKDC